jgi:hypothetical protein
VGRDDIPWRRACRDVAGSNHVSGSSTLLRIPARLKTGLTALAPCDVTTQGLRVDQRTTTIARTLLALLAVIALGGCGGEPSAKTSPTSSSTPRMATSEAPATRITVTLGMYSGRPDPSWDLTEAQVAQVGRAIAVLPVTTGTPSAGGLGYHGFTLLLDRPGKPAEALVAYRGTVASPGVDARPYRIDAGRTVERLLLEAGRSILTPIEVAAVEADLAAGP